MNTSRRFLAAVLVVALLSFIHPPAAQAQGAVAIPSTAQASVEAQGSPGAAASQTDPRPAGTVSQAPQQSLLRPLYFDPGSYRDEIVEVECTVTQYIEHPAQSTDFYYCRDDFGVTVQVRTARGQNPEVDERYRLRGVVDYETVPAGREGQNRLSEIPESVQELFESAALRSRLLPFISEYSLTPVVAASLPPPSGPFPWLMIALIALAGLVLVGLGVALVRTIRKEPALTTGTTTVLAPVGGGTPTGMRATGGTPTGIPPAPVLGLDGARNGEPEVVEGKTIKLHRPANDQTVKVLPGRFKVVGGLDEIPEIRFFMPRGRQTAEITFGRANGRPYEHIQLKPRTVSSRQAKLVFDGGQYTLVNHASRESNPTHVNGRELSEGESVRLSPGDRITMGEVEFEYAAG